MTERTLQRVEAERDTLLKTVAQKESEFAAKVHLHSSLQPPPPPSTLLHLN